MYRPSGGQVATRCEMHKLSLPGMKLVETASPSPSDEQDLTQFKGLKSLQRSETATAASVPKCKHKNCKAEATYAMKNLGSDESPQFCCEHAKSKGDQAYLCPQIEKPPIK